VVIIGAQIILPAAAPPPDAPGLAARRTRPVQIPLPKEYPAILASPIFAPDRRPGSAGGAADTGGGTLAGYAALGAVTGGSVAAGVVSAPGGGTKTLKRGDEVEGWRLIAVQRTRLVFERHGERHALEIGAPAEATVQKSAAAAPEASDQ
jgi:hypothetical protein